ELVVDAAREITRLEEVHEALEPGGLPALANRHLHVRALPAQHQLGHLVHLEPLVGGETVEHLLDARVFGAERLFEPGAEGLQIEEVEIEQPIEGRKVSRLLHERARERRFEGLTVFEANLTRGGERIDRLARRDAHLGAPKVANELENSLVHVLVYSTRGHGHPGCRHARAPPAWSARLCIARASGVIAVSAREYDPSSLA